MTTVEPSLRFTVFNAWKCTTPACRFSMVDASARRVLAPRCALAPNHRAAEPARASGSHRGRGGPAVVPLFAGAGLDPAGAARLGGGFVGPLGRAGGGGKGAK